MMIYQPGSVEIRETLAIRVGNFIREQGFEPASSEGVAIDNLTKSSIIGILFDDPRKAKRRLRRLPFVKQRRVFIGTIQFGNPKEDAKKDSWVIDAYGRSYQGVLEDLSNELLNISQSI